MSHPKQPYTKPARSVADLIGHLKARGLVIEDEKAAEQTLRYVGYYRMLIYMRPLQDANKVFQPHTRFEDVVERYNFDRELRLVCLDGIERVEVALRAVLGNTIALSEGPHFYLERRHFERINGYALFLRKASSVKYLAVEHYNTRYNDPPLAPIWAVMEAVTFGDLSQLYSGLHVTLRKAVAREFNYDEKVLVSWFRSLNLLRNMCAHHNRLWNARLTVDTPMAAKAVKLEILPNHTFYARAVVLRALLESGGMALSWTSNLEALLQRYPHVQESDMGFLAGWRARVPWTSLP